MKIINESKKISYSTIVDYETEQLDVANLKKLKISMSDIEKISKGVFSYSIDDIDSSKIFDAKYKFIKIIYNQSEQDYLLLQSDDKNLLNMIE